MNALVLPFLLLAASSLLAGAVKVPLATPGKHHPKAGSLRTPWHRWQHENPIQQQHVVGMRIPRRFFVTKGEGKLAAAAASAPPAGCSRHCRQLPRTCHLSESFWRLLCLSFHTIFLQDLEKPTRGLAPILTRRGPMT